MQALRQQQLVRTARSHGQRHRHCNLHACLDGSDLSLYVRTGVRYASFRVEAESSSFFAPAIDRPAGAAARELTGRPVSGGVELY